MSNDQITKYTQRHVVLKNERSSWMPHWMDLSDYILPRSSRLLGTDSERNAGDKRNTNIINNTATRAVRILTSGMQSGITSPARPWFQLTTPDPDLAEFGPVKEWLHVVENRLRTIIAKSNLYNCFHTVYRNLAVYGTAPLHIDEDDQDVIRGYVLPLGQFSLASSARLEIDTTYREMPMTVAQIAEMFGIENASEAVKHAFREGQFDKWFNVTHLIQPNRDYQEGQLGPRGKPIHSCWYMSAGHDGRLLRESGFDEKATIVPRWDVTGEDVYGHSPGMETLGDIKALQLYEKRKAQGVELIISPPMKGPASLLNQRITMLPGDFTPVSENSGQTLEPSYRVDPGFLQAVELSTREHEERINAGFFADLWLMMADTRKNITATEVNERHEEKMLQLGPVMTRLESEFLTPVIDRVFGCALRRGFIPPPPVEVQGQDMKIEFVSVMAQAQKLLSTSSVERLAGFVGSLAAVNPSVLDKVNFDAMASEYAEMLGTNPKLLHPDEVVAQVRAARAKAQETQAQQAQMGGMVQGAKTLSETDMEGDSALSRLMGALGGVAGASVRRAA